jgi:hypothetical protein
MSTRVDKPGEITREYVVWCGLCTRGERYFVKTLAAVERFARAKGWVETKTHGWVCVECATVAHVNPG